MVDSFVQAGFDPLFCEFLYLDNQNGNRYDGYSGGNLFLQTAQGQYIILCHQDIRLQFDRLEDLERCIRELDAIDPAWAVLGSAGGVKPGIIVSATTHSCHKQKTGYFPVKVTSLDENFMLVKREANLCLSHDLSGFHFYGTDLCQITHVLGWTAWVVDFSLYHKSRGHCDDGYFSEKNRLIHKYKSALRGRAIQTTCTTIFLTGSAIGSWLLNAGRRWTLFHRAYMMGKRSRDESKCGAVADRERLITALGRGWYAVFWIFYKLRRPFQRFNYSLTKRIFWKFIHPQRLRLHKRQSLCNPVPKAHE